MANAAAPVVVQWLAAVGSIATPILLGVVSGIGWAIKRRADERRAIQEHERDRMRKLEDELREDRLAVYDGILEPFIVALMKDEWLQKERQYKGKSKEQIIQEAMLTVSYRRTGFRLSLFASDDVMRAYNGLMQLAYKSEAGAIQEGGKRMVRAFGELLLAIRRSVGNEQTALDTIEMLEWMITDPEKLST